MSIRYSIKLRGIARPITNLDSVCARCSQTCSIESEVLNCHATGDRRRRALIDTDSGVLYLCSNETVKSARVFRDKVRAFTEVLPFVLQSSEAATRDAADYVHRLVHNLVTLNAHAIQAVYRVVPQDVFGERNRESLIRSVAEKLSDPEQAALLVVNLLKIATLEKTEFDVYTKLHEQEPVSLRAYRIRKIFMLVLSTYWEDLKDKGVDVRVGRCQERVFVDRDTVAASLVHILDNTAKYILPRSIMNVSFECDENSLKLAMDMVSLRIHPDEISEIGSEGFSGSEPKKIDRQGEGRGLFLVHQLLSLSNSALKVERDCDPDRRVHRMGVDFENNRFTISIPRR